MLQEQHTLVLIRHVAKGLRAKGGKVVQPVLPYYVYQIKLPDINVL